MKNKGMGDILQQLSSFVVTVKWVFRDVVRIQWELERGLRSQPTLPTPPTPPTWTPQARTEQFICIWGQWHCGCGQGRWFEIVVKDTRKIIIKQRWGSETSPVTSPTLIMWSNQQPVDWGSKGVKGSWRVEVPGTPQQLARIDEASNCYD